MTTNYLPQSQFSDVGSVLYSPTAASETASSRREGREVNGLDTIGSASGEAAQRRIIPSDRPALTPSISKIPVDALMVIAQAFCKAYSSMTHGITTQTEDYANLQTLNETQTQSILQSTTNAINQQKAAEAEAASVASYQSQMADLSKGFDTATFVIGLLLMVATIASAFFTGGATLAALPEEAEFEMADMAADVGSDVAEDAAEDVGDSASDMDVGMDDMEGVGADDASTDTTEDTEETQQTNRDLENSDSEASESTPRWKKILAKMGRLGFTALMASPMLVKGIAGLTTSDKLHQLSADQKSVGEALSSASSNNFYFQFLQQNIRREGGILNEIVSSANEVLSTYADLTNALKGISAGLASAA